MKASKSKSLIPKFPGQAYTARELEQRLAWLEEVGDQKFEHINAGTIPAESMRGNIENPVGVVQMPLGIAGPLLMKGEHAEGVFFVPLATTEGALVSSYERGMALLSKAGGVHAHVFGDENQICPVFQLESVADVGKFCQFLKRNQKKIRDAAESTTSHGKLVSCTPFVIGREVEVSFRFSTGDAHGMNMVSKAADAACRFILGKSAAKNYLLFSGLSSEKRPSGKLLSGGKGKSVTAAAVIPAKWLKLYLHATPQEICDLWRKTVIGNMMANAIGYCGHFANGLTALFIATGQDVANIMNSAVGITDYQITESGDLHASVTIPSMTVATVGGGVGLGTSRECLEMLDCFGTGKARKFAEIAAATLLAGELSFAGALTSGEFVNAHDSLGRNRPEEKP
ncbi:MAG: hydroxymethylglutaryl-CoA reductase (NADPH) [Verrucomicrobiales bacterium]|jgi:hydroxymethylglutaryl-CoA reductase (NADPH)